MYFMPAKKWIKNEVTLRYSVQVPLVRSNLPKDIFSVINAIDFDNLSDQVPSDGREIFKIEKSIIDKQKNQSNGEFLLTPNVDLIQLTMEEIFNQPRNINNDIMARDMVASYIYEKMGRSGLILTVHDFKHEMPLKEYGKLKGISIEVRRYF
jgi:hypothetical protein